MVGKNTIDNVCTWCDKEFKSERGVAIQRICTDRPKRAGRSMHLLDYRRAPET
jgi:hypothetical protein